MKRYLGFLILFFGTLIFSFGCQKPVPSDQIFYNGKIFTARSASDFVTAMAIKKGKIIAVGSDEKLLRGFKVDSTRMINLKGRLVLPGFHDAHLHFWNGTKIRYQVNLIGVKSLPEALRKIRRVVEVTKPGGWIIGRGWDHELWAKKKLPDRRDLDKISTNHLIYLKRVDGHAAWVNTAVLNLLRYRWGTPDPQGGKIMRRRNGSPSGILLDTAFELLDDIIPDYTFSEKKDMVLNSLKYANSLGITSITDNSPLNLYPVYASLQQEGKLSARVHFWPGYTERLDSISSYIMRNSKPTHLLDAPLIKLYADGSLGSRSAFLKEPYEDSPGSTGLPRHPFDELLKMARKVDDAGLQIGVHAIGDAAVSEVLDVYGAIQKENPKNDRRWRIEHSQILDSTDFKRYKELKVIASMQPSHSITDLHWAEDRIGKRARFGYAWRTFLDSNVVLAFGTDWPVEPLNPMLGLYAAVTRQDTAGFPEGGWYPQERISLGEAIVAYTRGSAYGVRAENWSGTLQPGRVADFVIMDRDLFTAAPRQILHAKVLATYLNGRNVLTGP